MVHLSEIRKTLDKSGLLQSFKKGSDFDENKLITSSEFLAQAAQPDQIVFLNIRDVQSLSYVQLALARRVLCVVLPKEYENRIEIPKNSSIIFVSNVTLAKSLVCFKHFVVFPKHIIGVTGSSGKTGTSYFAHKLAENIGLQSAHIGTMGVQSKSVTFPRELTTPDPTNLVRYINALNKKGLEILSLEVSGQAIQQNRFHSLPFSSVGLTYIGDAHRTQLGSMEDIRKLKFSFLQMQSVPCSLPDFLLEDSKNFIPDKQCVTYGFSESSDLRILAYDMRTRRLSLSFQSKIFNINVQIYGKTQLYNALGGLINVAVSLGDMQKYIPLLIPHLENLRCIPGRMERIGEKDGVHAFVDYAHHPDALQEALQSLKSFIDENASLHLVIGGSGGNEDTYYFEESSRIARDYADKVYITDDNPRDKNPQELANAMLQHCDGVYIPNRREALFTAMDNAKRGDLVVAVGKGDESTIQIGKTLHAHSDRDVLFYYTRKL